MRDLLTTVLVIGPSTTSSGWLMEKATARAKSTEYHEIGSGIQTTDPASNFMVPGEGFEPDRGVARRDSHEPIARGALSGSQSRAALLRGTIPPDRSRGNQGSSVRSHRARYPLYHPGGPDVPPHPPSGRRFILHKYTKVARSLKYNCQGPRHLGGRCRT